jgi:S-adenosyl-L-methionine hydrolase (adenosine-forming)
VKPSGLVTLLTDFGVSDPYAAVMKGVILSASRTARVVDITHGVPPQDVVTGSVFLGAAAPYFPPGCVHLVVVDPGVGGPRRAVAVQTERNWYVAPDNGVLTQILADEAVTACVDITGFAPNGAVRSATFHGRDIFAPVCGLLASGVPLADLGPPARDLVRVESQTTRGGDGSVRGRVLFADSFGNLVSNVRRRDVPADTRHVRLGDPTTLSVAPPVSHYGAVAEGAALTLWNSYDLLEIALNGGHMGERVGWRPGAMLAVTVER